VYFLVQVSHPRFGICCKLLISLDPVELWVHWSTQYVNTTVGIAFMLVYCNAITTKTDLVCAVFDLMLPYLWMEYTWKTLEFGLCKGSQTIRTLDCSYPPGLFIPWTIRTIPGLFIPWMNRTLDYSYHALDDSTMLRIKDN